ncbi:MAG: undecaprenyl-diphosphate phosphatase [Clostridia bacterium]|nr:undecaprenyl-diphosphate phosphatase [Clostridia bacterium]
MSIIEAIFYGIVQGLAEFLPISSSGHLSAIQNLFGGKDLETDFFTFDILLHLGTLAAVLLVYRKDVLELIKGFFSLVRKIFKGELKNGLEKYERLVICLVIATLPLIPAAFLKDYVEALYGMTKVIGALLIFNGTMLFVSDKLAKKQGGEVTEKRAIGIGLIQLVALLPGVSRSGSTITGGLLLGVDRKEAVKFSFLLSIPAIVGANVLSVFDLADNPIASSDILPYALGMIAAALSGIAAIKLLQYITNKNRFGLFTIYCVAVGVVLLIVG